MKFSTIKWFILCVFVALVGGWVTYEYVVKQPVPKKTTSLAKLPSAIQELPAPLQEKIATATAEQEPVPEAQFMDLPDFILKTGASPEQRKAIEQTAKSFKAMRDVNTQDDDSIQDAIMNVLAAAKCLKTHYDDVPNGDALREQVPRILLRDKALASRIDIVFSVWNFRKESIGTEEQLSPSDDGCAP